MMASNTKFNRFLHFPVTRIFIGLFVVAVAAMISQNIAIALLKKSGLTEDIVSLAAGILAATVALLAYIFLFRFYEKRNIEELSTSGFLRNILTGMLTGFIILSLVILIMFLGSAYHVTTVNPVSYLLPALGIALSSGVFEELIFRGIIFRITESRLGSIWALLISSSVFGFAHLGNAGSTLFSALAITVEAGILLGAAYLFSKNLWLPIGLHFAWNFSEGGIYGAIISGSGLNKTWLSAKISGPELLTGGAFGPENSIQAVLLGLCAGILFLWLARQRHKLQPPYRKNSQPQPAG